MLKTLGTILSLAVLVVGCGSADQERAARPIPGASTAAAQESAEPSAAPAPIAPAKARAALERGVRAVAAEGVTTFRFEMSTSGVNIETSGRYTRRGWSALTEIVTSDRIDGDTLWMHTRSVGGEVYMQMVGWPPPRTGCWLPMAPGAVPVGILALRPDEPAYVSVLADLTARGFDAADGSVVLADLGLRFAALLMSGQSLEGADATAGALTDAVVPVTVTLAGARIRTLRMAGEDISAAFRDAGVTLSLDTRLALPSLNYSITYDLAAAELVAVGPIVAPPEDLVMTLDSTQDGCEA